MDEEMVEMLETQRQYTNNIEVLNTIRNLTMRTSKYRKIRKNMSEINKTSQQSLQRILDKIELNPLMKKEEVNKSTLGQEDFLKLMTTQLQNQDPFAPMENGDFIAQMAQFSTVTGITEMSII